jgi:hypothetical protein
VQFVGNVPVDDFVHQALPINLGILVDEVNAQGGGDEQQVVVNNADRTTFDLGNGARVVLCQPANCNWTANFSCDQPWRWRSLLTCRPIKFSFFMAIGSEFNGIHSALFSHWTKCSLCF